MQLNTTGTGNERRTTGLTTPEAGAKPSLFCFFAAGDSFPFLFAFLPAGTIPLQKARFGLGSKPGPFKAPHARGDGLKSELQQACVIKISAELKGAAPGRDAQARVATGIGRRHFRYHHFRSAPGAPVRSHRAFLWLLAMSSCPWFCLVGASAFLGALFT